MHGEEVREIPIPPDICYLLAVDEYQKSEKNGAEPSLEHFCEEDTVHCDIKGLGHIHGAHEDFRSMSEKVVNSFQYSICTHTPRYARLIGILQIIETKGTSKEQQNNPIQEFENAIFNPIFNLILKPILNPILNPKIEPNIKTKY